MKTWFLTPLLVAMVLGVALPSVTLAAGGNTEAVLALHIGTRVAKNVCGTVLPSSCGGYTTSTIDSGFYNLYLTVAQSPDSVGVAGVQFGIAYDGATGAGCDVSSWTSCADLEFQGTGWPDNNTGNVITWEPSLNCQMDTTGVPILVGVFEVITYTGDTFSITPRPVDGLAKVADCTAAENDLTGKVPSALGTASFGEPGYNPCSTTVPVARTTWGSIKTLYEN